MKTLYILNGFSTNMIKDDEIDFKFKKASLDEVKTYILQKKMQGYQIVSGVGHQSTADMLTTLLGMQVQFNRINVTLDNTDCAIVFTLGIRAPEGKIYTLEELQDMLNSGAGKFYIVEPVTSNSKYFKEPPLPTEEF